MVDTQLDSIVKFLDTIDGSSVKHIEDAGRIEAVGSGNRILVYEPMMTGCNWGTLSYTYDYPCEMDYDTETNMTAAYNALLTNINLCNRRAAIASYTKPPTLLQIALVDWKLSLVKRATDARAKARFTLRVEWSTA